MTIQAQLTHRAPQDSARLDPPTNGMDSSPSFIVEPYALLDARLEDSQVSRRHAILAVRGDGARILDDRSYNGTFVNGRRVTVHHLTDGDVLRFGRAVFRFTEIAPRRRAEPLRRIPLARHAGRSEPAGAAA